jgi:glycosyltransferase involved in cell wall biosynthesis
VPTSIPRVSFGMLVYNETRHFREAIESVLNQTMADIEVVVVDDCSTDDTVEQAREYARRDSRVRVLPAEQRNGYGINYRRAYAASNPQSPYFTWVAGHDRHHPRWAERLVAALEEDPSLALAYPLSRRIGDEGELLEYPCHRFQTAGLDVRTRCERTAYNGRGFGNIIYGLFRRSMLEQFGPFPVMLMPDTLLLAQSALYGGIKLVEEELWDRRYIGLFSIERQRRNVFRTVPWYARLPWPVAHAAVIAWRQGLRPSAGNWQHRRLGLRLAAMHLEHNLRYLLRDAPRAQPLEPFWRAGLAAVARIATGRRSR